jgi:hypothetical protein
MQAGWGTGQGMLAFTRGLQRGRAVVHMFWAGLPDPQHDVQEVIYLVNLNNVAALPGDHAEQLLAGRHAKILETAPPCLQACLVHLY